MSSNDGFRGEDGFYIGATPSCEVPSPSVPLQNTQTQASTSAGSMQASIMWQPPLLNQQYIQHQPHVQPLPPQQQQQQYNEIYYNMHPQAAFAAPPVQPETYSVLPVGHGNFLKVYHRPKGGPAGGTNDAAIIYQPFQQQQQFHLPAAQQAQPIFNSYELFASNTLMSTTENSNGTCASQNLTGQELPMQQPTLHWLGNDSELPSSAANSSTNTNMIINKLVNNWSPNLTGGAYSQLSAPLCPVTSSATVPTENAADQGSSQLEASFPAHIPAVQSELTASENLNAQLQDAPILAFTNVTPVVAQTISVQSNPHLPQTTQQSTALCAPVLESQQQQQKQQLNSADASSPPVAEVRVFKESSASSGLASTIITGSVLPSTEGGKKRIVAEVKPMRMTYSDVLSKLNNQHTKQVVQAAPKTKSSTDRKSKIAAPQLNERKTEHKRITESQNSNASQSNQRQTSSEDGAASQTKTEKKSPIHVDSKENVAQSTANSFKLFSNKQRFASNTSSNNAAGCKQTQKTTQKTVTTDAHSSGKPTASTHKKRVSKRTETDSIADNSSGRFSNKTSASSAPHKDFNGFYNVAAKNIESSSKSPQNGSSSSSSNNLRRSVKSNSYPTTSSSANQSTRSAQRSSNNSTSSSYGFSTKRGRNANAVTANNTRNRNYELAKKFLNTWIEYTMKILTWLFYLVYDIVVLGFSMAYERLSHYCVCGLAYAKQLRKDLRQNSNKPSIWLKNYWRRFDARFKKNSRWAFWRLFHKKKQAETTADFYKNGRLPQTGEEAMYSLLNCKGKDAYSILSVPRNSTQEQIRKHYKKIAVLVHPDKNKQAGAEEAFKVLQRAFELIGEPENRESYDRSLDEALHAEKAWTELHDLLSQLQTKITEAANTIRCSTCGLRHPRKLTDRPHYAARECASCKIRHSAREGDIWAETTMLGLRWKYLALMEGKVYNITEWANCQKGALSHLEPNSHTVQYRIVRGAQNQQTQQQQQSHQAHQQQTQAGATHHQFPHSHPQGGSKYKHDIPPSEASLHEFLDNLYSGQHPSGQANSTAFSGSTRKRTRRN